MFSAVTINSGLLGGVKLEALTSDFELRDMKNVFCIGEFTNVDGGKQWLNSLMEHKHWQ